MNTNGAGGSGDSYHSGVSADGRFAAFSSDAGDLAPGDNNFQRDVFLRDLVSGTTRLVSVNHTGTGSGAGDSYAQRMTPDARFIAFQSDASDLVTNDFNDGYFDVFLRDMSSNVTELISVNLAGTGSGNDISLGAVVSADGRYVAFHSVATDLHPADTDGGLDVYVRDRVLGTNILCSIATNHASGGDDESFVPVLSANGRVVVFRSYAANLTPGLDSEGANLFAYDILSGQLQLVSVNLAGIGGGNDSSYNQVVSADGRYVAFQSYASNLVPNDFNADNADVFVRDLVTGTTTLVSVRCDGTGAGNGGSTVPAINADGRFVTFVSHATDLVSGDVEPFTQNIFRRDLLTGTTLLLSFNHARTGSGDNHGYDPSISADGRAVAFGSYASDLIEFDDNEEQDVFLWRAPAAGPPGTNAAIAALRMVGGRPVLDVRGSPGTLYLLQRTTSLTPPVLWTPLGTTNAPVDGRFEFIDLLSPVGSSFYRVARP